MAEEKTNWRNWGDHPVVVIITVVAAIIAIVAFVFGKSDLFSVLHAPFGKDDSATSPVPVGRALFLDVSQGQDEWYGLTAWAEGSGLQINLLHKPFEPQSFPAEGPGVFIFPLPYRQMLDDKKAIAIKNWVERGGGLLVLGYYAADSHHGSNVSRLTREWGITFNDDLVMPPGAHERDTREQVFSSEESLSVSLETKGSTHPLVFGVNRVVLLSAASLDVRYAVPRDFELKTSPSSEIWHPEGPKDPKGMRPLITEWVKSGQESAVVLTSFGYGKGKVAVVGTWKIVTLPYGDNRKFIDNMIDWIRPR